MGIMKPELVMRNIVAVIMVLQWFAQTTQQQPPQPRSTHLMLCFCCCSCTPPTPPPPPTHTHPHRLVFLEFTAL